MSKTQEELRAAKSTLNEVLGRGKRPTTEDEFDECVQTLEDFKRACDVLPNLPREAIQEGVDIMRKSCNEVIARLKNRQKP